MPLPRRSRPFGDLEATVMDQLWSAGRPLLVRDVIDAMSPDRTPAYTTVMTVMDNLHRKGWLARTRDGRAWRYEPVLDRQAYTARLMREALAVSEDRAGVLARFVEEISPAEAGALAAALQEALAPHGGAPDGAGSDGPGSDGPAPDGAGPGGPGSTR
jgi:predicted transcriptional regulator